jgi:hypothetical protein
MKHLDLRTEYGFDKYLAHYPRRVFLHRCYENGSFLCAKKPRDETLT